jgi:aminoglycoside phosphotransferase (APT) family kinase protein
VVEALADLHMVDPASCDLGDLGHPEGFVARQVAGWSKRWELVASDTAADMTIAAAALARTQPVNPAVVILHNDLKPDNCQFEVGRPDRVHSVFDWDMATLGDPLVDLGTLLNYWPDPADTSEDRGLYADGLGRIGLPTRQEVIARYAARTGADVGAISWYEAFACWKTAVVLRQLEARYLAGRSDDAAVAERAKRIPSLAARALRILGEPTGRTSEVPAGADEQRADGVATEPAADPEVTA